MSYSNLLNKKIILPISDILLGQDIAKNLNFLLESQFWSYCELEYYQNEKLRNLIKHSYENVQYYRELFNDLHLKPSDIKTNKDLHKIPLLTKNKLKENIKSGKIIAQNISPKNIIVSSSSGSTGVPLQYFRTRNSVSFNLACNIRSWTWMGYKLGDKYIKISMNPRKSRIKKIQDFLNNCCYLSSQQLTEEIFLSILAKIESYDPKIIRSYPVPLFYLSSLIEKRGGINLTNLKALNTTGSILHNHMRDKIQQIFRCKIHDSYSCEGGSITAQCETLENYHPAGECAISEFIDDNFSVSHCTRPKRHITTDLFNYVTPFIRYDSQDYVVLGGDKKCKCGRDTVKISKIIGRDGDILVTPGGKYLLVENFVAYFENIPSIDQFQVYQEEQDLIWIKLVVNEKYKDSVKNELFHYWSNYIGDEVKLNIDIVDNIELSPLGKLRLTVRNPEIKFNLNCVTYL